MHGEDIRESDERRREGARSESGSKVARSAALLSSFFCRKRVSPTTRQRVFARDHEEVAHHRAIRADVRSPAMEPEEPLMQGILLLPPQGMLGQLKVGSRREIIPWDAHRVDAIRDIARATHHPRTAVPLPLPFPLFPPFSFFFYRAPLPLFGPQQVHAHATCQHTL